jgi:hypothetical protein
MPTYCFACEDCSHKFVKIFHGYPSSAVLKTACEKCKKPAKRDFTPEIKSQSIVGQTPIRPSTSKFSVGRETEFGFGRFKRNPDGSVDKNHSPFGNTAELDRFMNGANDLGGPVIDDNGEALRVGARNPKTGEVRHDLGRIKERRGAKLFKYGKNDSPPSPPPPLKRIGGGAEWVGADAAEGFGGGVDRQRIYKRR